MTKNIFEAVASGDIGQIIAVVDQAFKAAARKASVRAYAKGILVADGRAGDGKEKHQ